MEWSRSSTIGLALASCTHCGGHGIRELQRGGAKPCHCVYRAIFRACFERFQEYANAADQPGAVSLETNHGRTGYRVYSLKRQEFVADFCLAARRALSERDYKLFRYVFLLGADYRLCCRYLGTDKGYHFHEVYRVEAELGKYFAEVKPYPLYPIDEYMGGTVRTSRITISSGAILRRRGRKSDDRLPMIA